MLSRASLMLVLFLMVSTPLSAAISTTAEVSDEYEGEGPFLPPSLSESERLEWAASQSKIGAS